MDKHHCYQTNEQDSQPVIIILSIAAFNLERMYICNTHVAIGPNYHQINKVYCIKCKDRVENCLRFTSRPKEKPWGKQ